jgi:hypothetical protein
MKKLTLTEKFTLEVGFPLATSRAERMAEEIKDALIAMKVDFDSQEKRDGFTSVEFIFFVDIREASVIADIFDRIENKNL